MRVNPFLMPMLIIVALFGTVFTAQAMGQWTTTGRIAIDPNKMTAADLKGWMTLQDIMNGLKISQTELYAAGKIPTDIPPSTPLNKLETLVPGFSVTTLREALTTKTAAAPTPPPTPPLPSAASAAPMEPMKPTLLPSAQDGEGSQSGVLPADQIKGKMSLKDVSQQCAVPLDKLLAGMKMPGDTNPDTLIKDLITQGKITEVTDVQKVVSSLQAK